MRIFCLLFAFALLKAQPTISTFAGLPPAEGKALGLDYGLAGPSGLAEDSAGNIYLATSNIIYKVTPAGDAIRYAGTGWATGATADGFAARDTRLFQPQDPKVGPDGNLYFVEVGNNNAIRMVETSTGLIRTRYTPVDWTRSRAQFDLDVDGTLLIAALTPSNTLGIYRVAPQTQALTLVASFERLSNFAVEPGTGDFYVLSAQLTLVKWSRSSGVIADISPDTLTAMFKIRALGNGNLLLIGESLRRYTIATRAITPIAGAFTNPDMVEGALAAESGFYFLDALPRAGGSDYLVTQYGPAPLWRIDSTHRYRMMMGSSNRYAIPGNLPQNTRPYYAHILALPEGGGIIAADLQILRLKLNQPTTEIYANNLGFRHFAVDASENIYLSSYGGLYRLDRGASQIRRITNIPLGQDPTDALAVAPNGDPLFVSVGQPVVRWNGSDWVEYAAAPLEFRFRGGALRCNADGDLFYHLIRFRAATKTFERIQPIGVAVGELNSSDFDIDANANIYLPATNNRILRIDAGTYFVTTIAGGQTIVESGSSLPARAEFARDITVDRTNGDIYFSELNLPRIRRITGASNYLPNSAVSFRSGSAATVAPAGSTLDVTIGARTSSTQWQAVSDSSWITFSSAASSSGTGTLRIVVAPNTTALPRTGTVRIGDQVFTVSQEAVGVSAGLRFFPVTPCRVADTRAFTNAPALEAKRIRDFPIAPGPCAIPTNARAFALNVTVVPRGPLGYLTVWPAGETQPVVSTLNALDGRVKANAAVVSAGTNSAVSVYATDPTELIIDITGYFAVAGEGLEYLPASPCRAYDSRLGPAGLPLQFGNSIGLGCIPLNTNVVFPANFTAIPQKTLGYLALFDRSGEPSVSVLNAVTGTVTANMALVSSTSLLRVFLTDNSHLVVDINGTFVPPGQPGALRFYAVTPCRVLDTRLAGQTIIAPRSSREISVTGSACNIPSTARAYSVSATVVPNGVFGYLTLWPTGQTMPTVSTLNAVDAAITSNAAIVQAGTNGSISAFHSDSAHLLIDINGYFAP